jgi:hypothetical protein
LEKPEHGSLPLHGPRVTKSVDLDITLIGAIPTPQLDHLFAADQ